MYIIYKILFNEIYNRVIYFFKLKLKLKIISIEKYRQLILYQKQIIKKAKNKLLIKLCYINIKIYNLIFSKIQLNIN